MWVKTKRATGFTIVELLIVIVVIGILAAISIVAYNGIQSRAHAAQAQAAANNVGKLLAVAYISNGSYPSDLTTINSGNPMSLTDGTSYLYHPANNNANYCVTVTNTTTSYKVTDTNPTPTAGGCPGDGVGGVAPITNLVINSSFETDLSSWVNVMQNGDTAAVSAARANTGSKSMALTVASNAIDSYVEEYISFQPGTWTVSGYIYLSNNGVTYGNRDALFYNLGGLSAYPGVVAYNRFQINQWQRVSATFTTASAGSLGVRFYGPVGVTYVDSVMATAGSTLYGYADGFTAGWLWNGAVNNSTSTGPAP